MVKIAFKKWEKNFKELEESLRADEHLKDCNYKYLVEKTISIIMTENNLKGGYECPFEIDAIREFDDSYYKGYEGVLLYLIPYFYGPIASENEYILTYIDYGIIDDNKDPDPLQYIQKQMKKVDSLYVSEEQLKILMDICKKIIFHIVRPYNKGYIGPWDETDFEEVE